MPRAVLHPPVEQPESVMALVKPLSDGTLAICFVNLGDVRSEMSCSSGTWASPMRRTAASNFTTATKQNEGKFAERYVAVLRAARLDGVYREAREAALMADYKTCRTCGAPLGGDDIAIYRKLVWRGAGIFSASPARGLLPLPAGGDREADPLLPRERRLHAVSLTGGRGFVPSASACRQKEKERECT